MLIERSQAKKFIEDLLKDESPYISLDVETEPFQFNNPLKSHAWQLEFLGVGLFNEKRAGFILAPDIPLEFQEILNKKIIVAHNYKFDITVIEAADWNVDNVRYEDTMVLSWILDENRNSHGLKNLAIELLGKDPIKFKDLPVPEKNTLFYEEDLRKYIPLLAAYCIDDCRNTWELFKIFNRQLSPELRKAYEKVELPIVEVIRKMERRGILIDEKYLHRLKIDVECAIGITEKIAREEMQVPPDFNFASTKQLREYLFDEKKFEIPESFRTDKGQLTTGTDTLQYLYDKHRHLYLKALIRLRELQKIHSTYVQGLSEVSVNGVIHSSFHHTGTVTGRFSSSGPNLQQLPRGDQGYDIRRVFIPRPGYKFVIGDYSQAELRLVAYFSDDKAMLKAFEEGKDVHQATADIMKVSRTIAKTINFGVVYGQSAYGLAQHLNISKEDAQSFLNEYSLKFPGVMRFMKECGRRVKMYGFVHTLIRRYRRFPDYQRALKSGNLKWAERMERQGGNAVIQGSCADVAKVAMRNLHRRFKEEKIDAHILCQIHDELIIECREEDSKKMKEMVEFEMSNALNLGTVKMKVDAHICDFWKK